VTADYVRGARHTGVEADHAIVVHSGITSPPADLESFWAHHADRGVDVWKLDAGFKGWAEGVADLGADVAQSARLPVFIVGSSRNAAAIYGVLQASDVFCGAVLIGDASPSVPPGPLDTSLRQNTKPVLCIIGGTDTTSGVTAVRSGAGPVEVQTYPEEINRLMLTNPAAFSDAVLEWCLRQLSNHLNPTWRFE
jgi:hypothetical protein